MPIEQFVRLYPQRAPQIMWFLGAGASAAAGVPTAGQMVWEFKRQLYCADQRVSLAACSDLTNPAVQARIQQHFDDLGAYPSRGADDEYAFYFERSYPDELDRRSYIDSKARAATPSFGHLALAGLLKMDMARVIWTTNFDRTVEDAVARLFGSTSALVTATLGEPQVALQALNGGQWPLLGKIHGDFLSRRLKNTSVELQEQDTELRYALLEACRRFGMAVVGYSGRDDSVMETLREAISDGRGYPSGLFWFHRSGSTLSSQVRALLGEAQAKGIGAFFVEVETFDELLADVMRLIPTVPDDIAEQLDRRALRVTPAPFTPGSGTWPVMRLNALPVFVSPTLCRRFSCDIGGPREVRRAVALSGAAVVATRRQLGVLAFGSDTQIRKAFGSFNIRDWDVHAIESNRLRYESQEHGLLHDAVSQALARERPVISKRRRSSHLIVVDPSQEDDESLAKLREAVGQLTGIVPGTELTWAEATRIRLDYRLDRLWLLIEPTIWFEDTEDEERLNAGKEFRRDRLAARHNAKWNKVLDGWVELIVGNDQEAELRAFGIGDGLDAAFTIGRITGFSRRKGS
jgi:NAD-dependent SIR2 family protein deacetylase